MEKVDKKVFIALHLLLLFYSMSSVLSKLASAEFKAEEGLCRRQL